MRGMNNVLNARPATHFMMRVVNNLLAPNSTVWNNNFSTKEQDLNVQLSKLDAQGCEKIFQGKQSGASIRNEEKL